MWVVSASCGLQPSVSGKISCQGRSQLFSATKRRSGKRLADPAVLTMTAILC